MAQTSAATSKPRRRINPFQAGVSGAASLLFIAALWLLFAPVNLGGKFAYFFVIGNSMQPHITANDLVLLRTADRYDVGDVIGFRDPELGTVVHRIRALDGDRYITRGDNREADDPNRPSQSDVVGKEWHIVHNGARFMRTLQSPKSAVLLTIASVGFGMASAKPQAATRRMREKLARRSPAWVGQMSYKSMNGDQIVTLASTLLFTAIGLGAVMLWNGANRTITRDVVLDQTGKLQYTAAAGTGLYDGDKVTTGQPVFTQIGTQMPVSFTYEITPSSKDATVGGVKGMIRMVVEISQDNKWKREFEIVPPTPFAGTTATAQGVVDLKVLEEQAARMEQAALLKYPVYSVRILAEVKANGNISGRAQDYSFKADYPFELHELQLIPHQQFNAKAETPLNVKRESVEPWSTSLPIIGYKVTYPMLRILTVVCAIAGAAALALVYTSTMLAAKSGETGLILSRYSPLLVSVQAADVDFGGRIVAVKKFEDLVRMARADGLFIVHAENGVADHFLLVNPEVTYLYSVPRPPEKFRFDEEVKPSPNEALAGLTRPELLRPMNGTATAAVATGTIGTTAMTFRNGSASASALTTSAPVSVPVAASVAVTAPSSAIATPVATAPVTPEVAPRASIVIATAEPTAVPKKVSDQPTFAELASSPITGARPLPPMAQRPVGRSSRSTAALPETTSNGSTQKDPPRPPTGGKALV